MTDKPSVHHTPTRTRLIVAAATMLAAFIFTLMVTLGTRKTVAINVLEVKYVRDKSTTRIGVSGYCSDDQMNHCLSAAPFHYDLKEKHVDKELRTMLKSGGQATWTLFVMSLIFTGISMVCNIGTCAVQIATNNLNQHILTLGTTIITSASGILLFAAVLCVSVVSSRAASKLRASPQVIEASVGSASLAISWISIILWVVSIVIWIQSYILIRVMVQKQVRKRKALAATSFPTLNGECDEHDLGDHDNHDNEESYEMNPRS